MHQYLAKFESQIYVEISKSSRCYNSTWIRLSKLMKSERPFYVEFRRRIDGESTKMCPLAISLIRDRADNLANGNGIF